MRFSIIIPVYNADVYLIECLESVSKQDFNDYEVLCVNDGSDDSSPDILNRFEEQYDRIKVLNQKNQGMSAARNSALRQAKGDYILFVDSDDILEANALSIIDNNLYNEDLLCFNAAVLTMPLKSLFHDDGISCSYETGWDYYNANATKITKIHFVTVWQRAYRRQFLLDNKLFFDERPRKAEDDYFSTLVCYYAKKIKIIPNTLYQYRVHNNNISKTASKQRLFDVIYVYNKLSDFFIDKKIDKSVVHKKIASSYIGCFTKQTQQQFGTNDKEVLSEINIKDFKIACITKRHQLLFTLISINPSFFRIYMKIARLFH